MLATNFPTLSLQEKIDIYTEIYDTCKNHRMTVNLMILPNPNPKSNIKTTMSNTSIYVLSGTERITLVNRKSIQDFCNFKKALLCLKLRQQSEES